LSQHDYANSVSGFSLFYPKKMMIFAFITVDIGYFGTINTLIFNTA